MNLLERIELSADSHADLPFSIYRSASKQILLNVPVVKPLLVVVLSGYKELGDSKGVVCTTGEFVFLSDSPAVDMRNIPLNNNYTALLIEFDQADFEGMQDKTPRKREFYVGATCSVLEASLAQFIDISPAVPKSIWSLRKRELLTLLCHLGHSDILSLLASASLKAQIHSMFIAQGFGVLTSQHVCDELNLSESTLRRKLKQEGTSLQSIKDQARHTLALHLLQTTTLSIAMVAEQCGYSSQSRFTDWFKTRYGLTPTELRKTKVTD